MVRITGEVRFDGKPIGARATEEIVRLGIAHAPEGRGIFGTLSVLENLELGAYSRSDRAAIKHDVGRMMERFPILREWPADDLLMLAGLLVNTMIATIESTLDVPVAGPDAEAQIARTAEKQLRLTMLAIPHWRSARD